MNALRNVLTIYLSKFANADSSYLGNIPTKMYYVINTSFGLVSIDINVKRIEHNYKTYIIYELNSIEKYSLDQLWEIFLIQRATNTDKKYNDSARAVELAFMHLGYPQTNTSDVNMLGQIATLTDERDKALRNLAALQDKLKKIISI